MDKHQTPRPMTHDLPRNIIQDLQAAVDKLINVWRSGGDRCAYGDAIALALRTRAPVLVETRVIDPAKTVAFIEKQDSDRLQQWLESFDPDDRQVGM